MKSGIYGVYNNVEYRLGRRGLDLVNLYSDNSEDIKKGFVLYEEGIYVKTVKLSEITAIYSIGTYANYKGHKCQVLRSDNDKVQLISLVGDYKISKSLGFEMVDRGVYEKWLEISEVDSIYEEKTELEFK